MNTTPTAEQPTPVDEELLQRARQLAGDELPTKNALRTGLNVRWPVAVEVFRQLHLERSRQRAERAEKRDKVAARKKASALPPSRRTRRVVRLPNVAVDQVGKKSAAAPVKVFRPVPAWPLLLLALPAFVAIWSGWVDLGRLTGFGVVHPLPGIADRVALNTAITLPIGLETYAAYALRVWLSGTVPARARRFAKRSAIGALTLGAGGQVAYHLMAAAGITSAPWWITTVVACLPVAVLGAGAALAHMLRAEERS